MRNSLGRVLNRHYYTIARERGGAKGRTRDLVFLVKGWTILRFFFFFISLAVFFSIFFSQIWNFNFFVWWIFFFLLFPIKTADFYLGLWESIDEEKNNNNNVVMVLVLYGKRGKIFCNFVYRVKGERQAIISEKWNFFVVIIRL